jgi:hypothetical protein
VNTLTFYSTSFCYGQQQQQQVKDLTVQVHPSPFIQVPAYEKIATDARIILHILDTTWLNKRHRLQLVALISTVF